MRLDERVAIQGESVTKDEYGEETVTYSDEAEVWAAVTVSAPTESRTDGREEEQADVTVVMRTSAADEYNVQRDTRLRYDGDLLQVNGRFSNRRDGFTELTCTRTRQ
jgi:SPP1 family predicted phage head-tail adaptor